MAPGHEPYVPPRDTATWPADAREDLTEGKDLDEDKDLDESKDPAEGGHLEESKNLAEGEQRPAP